MKRFFIAALVGLLTATVATIALLLLWGVREVIEMSFWGVLVIAAIGLVCRQTVRAWKGQPTLLD